MDPIKKDLANLIINKQFRLTKKLGAGAFGEIYLALKNKEEYAIKLEKTDSKYPQVFFEAKLYNFLQGDSKEDRGIPRTYGSNTEGDYNYLIMDLLGKSIEDHFNNNNRKMSLKSVIMIAEQMVSRIEFIHSKQFIHRDIKPDNFLMGNGQKCHKVYIVDFGLAKRYQIKDGHIPYKENKSLTGTVRYASINTHLGIEQSRRDDLEGLGYVLIYLARGTLPWMNLKVTNQKEKYQQIMDKKIQTSSDLLCKGLPTEFVIFMNYVKALKFEEKPDYSYLRGLFKDIFKKFNFELDYKYDWSKLGDKITIEQPIIKTQPLPRNNIDKIPLGVKKDNEATQSVKGVINPPNAVKGEVPRRNTVLAKRPGSQEKPRNLQRQQSAKKDTKLLIPPVQRQVVAPRIVINKEPYQKN